MSDSRFTYSWYRSLIDLCKREGRPLPVSEAESALPGTILLRHDVDFDLEAADVISRLEESEGVRSSFFFLVSTDFYNIGSATGRSLLTRLVARGFDVGLHFDPSVYTDGQVETGFHTERMFLESVTGAPIRSVSLHVPSAHNQYIPFAGLVNAYDPRWFGPDRYVSDSCRTWRRDPLQFIASPRPDVVQVLTHPIHFSSDGASYGPLFDQLTMRWRERLHAYTLRYNATYRAECERGDE